MVPRALALGQTIEPVGDPALTGLRRVLVELLWFGVKEARACLFAGLFFAAVFVMPRAGMFGVPLFSGLMCAAVGSYIIQACSSGWPRTSQPSTASGAILIRSAGGPPCI